MASKKNKTEKSDNRKIRNDLILDKKSGENGYILLLKKQSEEMR